MLRSGQVRNAKLYKLSLGETGAEQVMQVRAEQVMQVQRGCGEQADDFGMLP